MKKRKDIYQGFYLNVPNTDNNAFNPVPFQEVARLLRNVANRVDSGQDEGKITDVNGNTVGEFYFRIK